MNIKKKERENEREKKKFGVGRILEHPRAHFEERFTVEFM